MAQPAPAPLAETVGSKAPAQGGRVPEDLGGIGILGLVEDGGRVNGEIEIVGLDPAGYSFKELKTKPVPEHGWDMIAGEVSPARAAGLEGVKISDVQIVGSDETPHGEGEHVRFTVSSETRFGDFVMSASMAEFEGPVEGLTGRHLPPPEPEPQP